ISTWEDVDEAVQESEGKPIEIVFVRDGERHVATTRPYHEFSEDGLELLGERWDLGLRHERRGNLIGVTDASPAYRAGLRTWDRLMGIGGVPVGNWDDIERLLAETGNEPVMVTILRQASLKAGAVEITIPLVFDLLVVPPQGLETRKERNVSIYGIEPADMYVMEVTPGLPAERNGIKPGDKLVSIDGVALKSWEQFSRAIIEGGSRPHELVVRSGTALRTITFTPETISQTNEFKQKTRKLGLGVSYIPNVVGGKYIPRPNRLSFAVKSAFTDTANAIVLNVMGFVRIFQGRVAPTEAIGGPIMIADIAAKSARKGMRHFFNMMAMLSVLLGLLNLLPIPILDGGHLLFLGIEAAMRKPLPEKVRIGASYVGFVLLAALMLFAFGNDIQRYLF
ncbi:MAG: PDZ domain-containing protein, partial [Deltaproteobacteria bacterium]